MDSTERPVEPLVSTKETRSEFTFLHIFFFNFWSLSLGIAQNFKWRKLCLHVNGRRSNRMFKTTKFLRSRSVRRFFFSICWKFFSSSGVDDDEIDLVVDSIQNRCATVRRIEHIGIHASFVYLKFSSKEAAAQGFHFLNNWRYNGKKTKKSFQNETFRISNLGRDIVAKYLRLPRYYDHFPEARDSGSPNN